jgi:cell division protease FtsH
MFLPERDQYSASKQKLESQISSLFGGRIAEELIVGKERVTTGAQNDIERATNLSRSMVTRWGLSERLGPLAYMEEEGEVFLGRSVTKHKSVSEETAHLIDEEIRSIIDRNYERSEHILRENMDKLHAMAEALMKYETIDRMQIDDIMEGREPREPQSWSDQKPPAGGETTGGNASKPKSSDESGSFGRPAAQH